MYLALTYDHRLLDGREAVTFLVKIKVNTTQCTFFVLLITVSPGIHRGSRKYVAGMKILLARIHLYRTSKTIHNMYQITEHPSMFNISCGAKIFRYPFQTHSVAFYYNVFLCQFRAHFLPAIC